MYNGCCLIIYVHVIANLIVVKVILTACQILRIITITYWIMTAASNNSDL